MRGSRSEKPRPRRSGATHRKSGSRAMTLRQRKLQVGLPWSSRTGRAPGSPWSMKWMRRPASEPRSISYAARRKGRSGARKSGSDGEERKDMLRLTSQLYQGPPRRTREADGQHGHPYPRIDVERRQPARVRGGEIEAPHVVEGA